MKKKLMRTLLAGLLACALLVPTACGPTTPSGGQQGGQEQGGQQQGGEQQGGEQQGGGQQQPEAATLTFEKEEVSVKAGSTVDVKITATKLEDITFESNKASSATVALKADKTAVTITALAAGTVTISAKAGGKTIATLKVTVTQDVKLSDIAETMEIDVEDTAAAITYNVNDSAATITASSGDTAVVEVGEVSRVDKKIPLTPKATGTAEITITASNSAPSSDTKTVQVTVVDMYDKADTSLFNFADGENGGYIISLKDKAAYIESIAEIEGGATMIIPSKGEDKKPVTEIADSFLATAADAAIPNLVELYIPATVKVIGESAFEGCAMLTTVHVKSGSQLETISEKAFGNCISLEHFDGLSSKTFDMEKDFGILTSLRTIELSAFYQHKFRQIYIPKSVTAIEDHAFAQPFNTSPNQNVLQSVYFEDDDNPDNAVSVYTEYYDQDGNHKGHTIEAAGLPAQSSALNCWYGCGVFTNSTGLLSVHLSNIKFMASNTFGFCWALSEVYVDANTAKDAFKERGTNGTPEDPNTQATGYVFWQALPATNTAVFIIDNAVIEELEIKPNSPLGDSAGLLGCRNTAGQFGWAGTVYVKDTLTPSESFKSAYTQEETSDREGYTCWKLKA